MTLVRIHEKKLQSRDRDIAHHRACLIVIMSSYFVVGVDTWRLENPKTRCVLNIRPLISVCLVIAFGWNLRNVRDNRRPICTGPRVRHALPQHVTSAAASLPVFSQSPSLATTSSSDVFTANAHHLCSARLSFRTLQSLINLYYIYLPWETMSALPIFFTARRYA